VTPALFKNGWYPDWLKPIGAVLKGTPPGANFELTLISVCNHRWTPVSGWCYEKFGPKPVRRMTPAGSVFFFERTDRTSVDPAQLWLESVSDEDQDRRDGFGLAVWGVW
jgi:CRISPR-associated protein Cmr3